MILNVSTFVLNIVATYFAGSIRAILVKPNTAPSLASGICFL